MFLYCRFSFQIVVFDQVTVNHGKAYRQTAGVFVTPHKGFYQFHMHVHTRKSFIAEVTLRVGLILKYILSVVQRVAVNESLKSNLER